uniref:Alanine--glyoxylate and serine--pyruvate aminotransferase a n=1 Tax=Sinocyclocheilus rhinocerous TaxID=307959 RepID=A0A673IYB5_9TELE
MSSLSVLPPECLLQPFPVPQRLMLGPGPSNVPARIAAAGAQPMLGHLHTETIEIMNQIKSGIQYAFQTRNRVTLAVSGPGHAAMECAIFNSLEPGESVLIAVNGIWGERAAEIAGRIGAKVNTVVTSAGGYFTNEEIEQALDKYRPVVFFLTHGESSTGVVHPIDGIGDLCHKYNCLFLVDSVAALGGTPICMDERGIAMLHALALQSLPAWGPLFKMCLLYL